ncbi:MAG TPA: ATPase domain-containing protein, partial [Thermomicrobiales bacterium]|nr:ATPase domain-containing protein [Thermomicrobiales bacterium]
HYISLLSSLQEGGFNELMRLLVETLRTHRATLLIIDGAGAARMLAESDFDYARFMHGLQARTALLNCTMVLLAGEREADVAATHVDGLIQLSNRPTHARDTRWLRVAKLRGSNYLNGQHRFAIGSNGITVFPRLESTQAQMAPAWFDPQKRLPVGIPGLDTALGGGLQEGSSTLAVGTTGAGKTLLGLHFLAEGARRGEPGLIASFNETPRAVVSTADSAGMGLSPHVDSGLVQIMWHPPLELAPDEWAWQLLATIDEHQPRRLVVDAISDLLPLFAIPERKSLFPPALVNRLRDRGVTTVFIVEVDAFVSPSLIVPVENLSATMDNGILLRTVEVRSSLRRMISILKQRQGAFDPTIRELLVGSNGLTVGDPFDASGLMTGSSAPFSQR